MPPPNDEVKGYQGQWSRQVAGGQNGAYVEILHNTFRCHIFQPNDELTRQIGLYIFTQQMDGSNTGILEAFK